MVAAPIPQQTRFTIEVHHFFVLRFLSFGELKTCLDPKVDLEQNQNCHVPDEKSHDLLIGTQRESCKKKNWQISDDFGLRSPVIQKPFSPKKGIP